MSIYSHSPNLFFNVNDVSYCDTRLGMSGVRGGVDDIYVTEASGVDGIYVTDVSGEG